MRTTAWVTFAIAAAGMFLGGAARAEEARVAVAANFSPALIELQKKFEAQTGHRLLVSRGASGALYAQIRNGAPFEVFLSADAERPKKLEDEKLAVAGSRFTYAVGRLVLWSPRPGVVDPQGAVLASGNFKKLAIAEPRTAPFGAAARETLQRLKLWDRLAPRLVQGIDIGQAYMFVASGNAELGLVAYSQLLAKGKPQGSWWLVDEKLYTPIRQQAVLLNKGNANKAARAFLDYLKTPEAAAVMKTFGSEVR